MVICMERGANDLHMGQLMPLPPHHLLTLTSGWVCISHQVLRPQQYWPSVYPWNNSKIMWTSEALTNLIRVCGWMQQSSSDLQKRDPPLSCFIKIQIGLTFLVPAYPGCPSVKATKLVSVWWFGDHECDTRYFSFMWKCRCGVCDRRGPCRECSTCGTYQFFAGRPLDHWRSARPGRSATVWPHHWPSLSGHHQVQPSTINLLIHLHDY